MTTTIQTPSTLKAFEGFLTERELSCSTRQQYLRAVMRLLSRIDASLPDRATLLRYKDELLCHYTVTSANAILAAWNLFFRFMKREDLRIKQFFRTSVRRAAREPFLCGNVVVIAAISPIKQPTP